MTAASPEPRRRTGSSARAPLVSVVIELYTRTVTGRTPVEASVQEQIDRRGSLTEDEVEYLFVGPQAIDTQGWGRNVASIAVPEDGYYAYKNAGALHARGKYIAFWDSDCRPSSDYLARSVNILESFPELSGVTGATYYDGRTWLTTVNTILTWGHTLRLQDRQFLPEGTIAIAHNLMIRSDAFPARPFGDHVARFGGDLALTEHAVRTGAPLLFDPGLVIWHEDISFSITALLEQHLREHFRFAPARAPLSKARFWLLALRSVAVITASRWRRLRRLAGYCGLTRGQAAAVPLLFGYMLLDGCAVLTVATVPRLRRRWLSHQFGAEAEKLLFLHPRGATMRGLDDGDLPAR